MREARSSRDLRVDALALALVPRVGPRQYRERITAHGSAAAAFCAAVAWGERDRLRDEARAIVHGGDACRARLLLLEDADYPRALLDLTDPPPFLFVYGDLALLSRHPVRAPRGAPRRRCRAPCRSRCKCPPSRARRRATP